MSQAQLQNYLTMAMDGVVLTVPPSAPHDRENHCRIGDTHMWRMRDEYGSSVLDGGSSKYEHQVPARRALPLWGGIGRDGFAVVCYHSKRKISSEEWIHLAVDNGKLLAACKKVCLSNSCILVFCLLRDP